VPPPAVPRRPSSASGDLSPGARRPPGRAPGTRFDPGPVYLGFAYALALLFGLVLGLYGSFLVPAGPRLGGWLLSYGVVLALIGNPGAAMAARAFTGTRLGAMTVLIGWAPVAVWLGTSRPEGDLVLQGDGKGYLFLAIGALAPIVVAVVGRTRRGLTALPPPH
jgi:hypothetical protein